MRITRREKVMLTILFILLLMFVYYDVFLNPRLKEIRSLRDEKCILEEELSNKEYYKNKDKLNKINVEVLTKDMNLLSGNFFNYIEEENVINIVDEIIKESEIYIGNMTIVSDQVDISDGTESKIYRFCVTLTYRDSFSKLMRFIWEIENYNKEIIISNLSITCEEVLEITGSVTLELYYCSLGNKNMKTEFYPGLNRENPFIKKY